MAVQSRYQQGQRWAFKPIIPEFENTLVIGHVTEAHPEWGWNERKFDVYVRYTPAAQDSIPTGYDGAILNMTDADLDRNVTELVESGVELPWWWVYGRRIESEDKAPNTRSTLQCDRLSECLPNVLRSAQQRHEDDQGRAEALRKHREKFPASAPRPVPSKRVAESWERIKAWFAEYAEDKRLSLAPGATDGAIASFEKEIGAKLPEDFKESVRLHDGGGWWIPLYRGELLSLTQILEQWRMYSDWQSKGEYATGDGWRADDIKGPIKPIFWNKKRIYVTDNSGDHNVLDLDPPPEGKYGQVIHHSHEVGPTEVLAESWAGFLARIVEDLETGKVVYVEHDNSLESLEEMEREVSAD